MNEKMYRFAGDLREELEEISLSEFSGGGGAEQRGFLKEMMVSFVR